MQCYVELVNPLQERSKLYVSGRSFKVHIPGGADNADLRSARLPLRSRTFGMHTPLKLRLPP